MVTIVPSFGEGKCLSIAKNRKKEIVRKQVKKKHVVHKDITITVYDPVAGQCDKDPLITADGSKINTRKKNLKWVAVSRDFLKTGKFAYGDKIKIKTEEGEIDGIYEIHDTMHKRFSKRVDILRLPGQKLGKLKWTGATIRKV